jgi:hypothetical protein
MENLLATFFEKLLFDPINYLLRFDINLVRV